MEYISLRRLASLKSWRHSLTTKINPQYSGFDTIITRELKLQVIKKFGFSTSKSIRSLESGRPISTSRSA
jgi:hypothetical protein